MDMSALSTSSEYSGSYILWVKMTCSKVLYEPVREKTNNFVFRPGPTQTDLYSHRNRLEA